MSISFFIDSRANCHSLNACLFLYFTGCRERCGVIKIRQPGVQKHWRERETVFQNGPGGLRRLTRKRYIDLGNEQTHSDKVTNDSTSKPAWPMPKRTRQLWQPLGGTLFEPETPIGPKTFAFPNAASVKHCQGDLYFQWALCSAQRSDITSWFCVLSLTMFKKHAVHLKWPLMSSERCRNFDNICSLQLLGIELVCLMFEIFLFFIPVL